ncbi:MAG: GNAT family N-acetyltransferase, partial [Rhodanobacter sp.]
MTRMIECGGRSRNAREVMGSRRLRGFTNLLHMFRLMYGSRSHGIMGQCEIDASTSSPESNHAEQRMALAIRDVREQDLSAVLALNNAAGRSILALTAAQLRYFHAHAEYFRVAEIDGHLAGFLIALREGGSYPSTNYRWFAERYPKFVYIDRIVIANAYRRHGLGRVFYCDV